jgi:hypothetical protein
VVEQPALARDATAVARERAVRTDDAMAWYHDSDRIGAVRTTNGSARPRVPKLRGELSVARCDAGSNRS